MILEQFLNKMRNISLLYVAENTFFGNILEVLLPEVFEKRKHINFLSLDFIGKYILFVAVDPRTLHTAYKKLSKYTYLKLEANQIYFCYP